jgi:hypothetical protein
MAGLSSWIQRRGALPEGPLGAAARRIVHRITEAAHLREPFGIERTLVQRRDILLEFRGGPGREQSDIDSGVGEESVHAMFVKGALDILRLELEPGAFAP